MMHLIAKATLPMTVVAALFLPAPAATLADIIVDPDNVGATDVIQDWTGSSIVLTNPLSDPLNLGTDSLVVGLTLAGALDIVNGGELITGFSVVGANIGASGIVNIDGSGSSWTLSDDLRVGTAGTGTLNVLNGAVVSSLDGSVGDNSTGTGVGVATISGSGSQWSMTGTMDVGRFSNGTVYLLDGATMSSSTVYVGRFADSAGAVTIDGGGSSWSTGNADFWLGNASDGTLNIQNGGELTSGISELGHESDAVGMATIDGATSSWTTRTLRVGGEGEGTLTIQNGGTQSSHTGIIGDLSGSIGTVTVDGVGSSWTTNGYFLRVGDYGDGTLNIQNGATVVTAGGIVALDSGSMGTLTIGGAAGGFDATLDVNGNMSIGGTTSAAGGMADVTINDGGSLLVDGDFRVWDTSTFTVNDGATVNLGGDVVVEPGALEFNGGTITVDGGDASFTSGNLFFGGNTPATQPTLVALNGATLSATSASLASSPGEYATMTLSGAAGAQPTELSLIGVSGNVNLASRGTAQFTVSDGARAEMAAEFALGGSAGGDGTLLVSGVNGALRSTVDVTGPSARIRVGISSTGVINVEDGAVVHSAGYVTIGEFGTSDGTITIGGAAGGFNATLQADGNVYVGGGTLGPGGTGIVNVNDAGSLFVGDMTVYTNGEIHVTGGGTFTSIGTASIDEGTVTVSGTDASGNPATWFNSLSVLVGTTSTGNLEISDGGIVSNTSGFIGNESGSDGTVTVTGTDGMGNASRWLMPTGNLVVGNFGAGTLDVLAGGEVNSLNGFVGVSGSGTGILTVSGSDSRWHCTHNVQVGRPGTIDSGTLNILDNGHVEIDAQLKLFATGVVTLDGGTLVADTIDHSNLGTFDFSGGVLSVVTFDGNLVNAGGTLAPGNSPGTTSVLGSYSQDASSVLEIELAGTTPGSQFDQVNVTGSATLNGTLDIVLIDPFTPMPGQSFEIMTFASRTGEFDTIDGGGLLGDVYLLEQNDATSVSLVAAIPGDATLDGQVDIGDFTVWGDGFQTGSEFTAGDFSGDGTIDIGDFTIWGDHFGEFVSAPGGSFTAVPEPSTLVLFAIGSVTLILARRRLANS